MIWQQIVNWLLTSVQEKYKLRTCCVQKLFWMPKQKQKTIFLHNMFSTCILLVLKSVINEQSDVTLWVNWFKNECFWKRFTCKKWNTKSAFSLTQFCKSSHNNRNPVCHLHWCVHKSDRSNPHLNTKLTDSI